MRANNMEQRHEAGYTLDFCWCPPSSPFKSDCFVDLLEEGMKGLSSEPWHFKTLGDWIVYTLGFNLWEKRKWSNTKSWDLELTFEVTFLSLTRHGASNLLGRQSPEILYIFAKALLALEAYNQLTRRKRTSMDHHLINLLAASEYRNTFDFGFWCRFCTTRN